MKKYEDEPPPPPPRSPFVVAVDGPAASGKGTVARAIADEFDFAHLDSGSLYRKVAYIVIRENKDPNDHAAVIACAHQIASLKVEDEQLRTSLVADVASMIAPIQGVRDAILAYQRNFADHPPRNKKGSVIDGRDIGTVVIPDANVKLFITASVEERARRRWLQLTGQGEDITFDAVLEDIAERDRRDRERDNAPLQPAADAHIIDNTEWDPEVTREFALSLVEEYL